MMKAWTLRLSTPSSFPSSCFDFCRIQKKELSGSDMERLYQRIRDSANHIIQRKGATYYGIAMAVGRIGPPPNIGQGLCPCLYSRHT